MVRAASAVPLKIQGISEESRFASMTSISISRVEIAIASVMRRLGINQRLVLVSSHQFLSRPGIRLVSSFSVRDAA